MKNEESNNKRPEKITWVDILSKFVFPLVAILISIVAWNKAEDVAKYQIAQERLPRVVLLNQGIQTSFETESQFYDYTMVDVSSITEGIKIPLYNIGVGVAQNCVVKADENSIKEACLILKDKLRTESYLRIGSFINLPDNDLNWEACDYNFEMEGQRIKTLIYWDSEKNEYDEIEVVFEDMCYPYILPIADQTVQEYVFLPRILTILLYEAANQNLEAEISVKYTISYQDLAGEEYIEDYMMLISFSDIEKENENVECVLNVVNESVKVNN